MNASTGYADDFDGPGRTVAGLAAIELVACSILMAVFPRWSIIGSFACLAILLGTIVALCAVAIPRRLRLVLVAGVTTLFMLTGARLDLLGTVGRDVAAHPASEDRTVPIVTHANVADEPHARSEAPAVHADTQDGWTADIDALTSRLSQAQGVRAIVRSLTVDRTVEPSRVALDWSVAVGDERKPCGSITIAAADRQVALDQIGETLRIAVARSRGAGSPLCY